MFKEILRNLKMSKESPRYLRGSLKAGGGGRVEGNGDGTVREGWGRVREGARGQGLSYYYTNTYYSTNIYCFILHAIYQHKLLYNIISRFQICQIVGYNTPISPRRMYLCPEV